jgi:hypothetical protein
MIRDRRSPSLHPQPADGARGVRPAAPAAEPVRRRLERAEQPRSALSSGLKFGALGFVLGAVFWHAVGFWNFVGRVVLNKGGTSVQAEARPPKQMARFVEAPQVAGEAIELTQIDPRSCTALVLNRQTGTMAVAACPDAAMPLRTSRAGVREDASLMPVRRNVSGGLTWSTTVEQQASAGD